MTVRHVKQHVEEFEQCIKHFCNFIPSIFLLKESEIHKQQVTVD